MDPLHKDQSQSKRSLTWEHSNVNLGHESNEQYMFLKEIVQILREHLIQSKCAKCNSDLDSKTLSLAKARYFCTKCEDSELHSKIVLVIGHTGAGKSTTINWIMDREMDVQTVEALSQRVNVVVVGGGGGGGGREGGGGGTEQAAYRRKVKVIAAKNPLDGCVIGHDNNRSETGRLRMFIHPDNNNLNNNLKNNNNNLNNNNNNLNNNNNNVSI
jgi:hypothetical protein